MEYKKRKRDRIRAGLSIEELAVAIGVSASTLFRWETGRSVPHHLLDRAWRDALARIEAKEETCKSR